MAITEKERSVWYDDGNNPLVETTDNNTIRLIMTELTTLQQVNDMKAAVQAAIDQLTP